MLIGVPLVNVTEIIRQSMPELLPVKPFFVYLCKQILNLPL